MKAKDFDVILEKHINQLTTDVLSIEYIEPTVRDYFTKCLIALKMQIMIDAIDFQIKEIEAESLELIKKLEK
jgi:hypothetical protein